MNYHFDLHSFNARFMALLRINVATAAKDIKAIYKHADGKYYIHNFTDNTESKLCDNAQYARKYGDTYGIEVRF